MLTKKTIITILSVFIFSSAFCQKKDSLPITKKNGLTAQDSAAIFQQEQGRFLDSLVNKTSVKQMLDFLQASVTVKEYNEAKWTAIYDFFLRAKLQEWMQQKAKPKK